MPDKSGEFEAFPIACPCCARAVNIRIAGQWSTYTEDMAVPARYTAGECPQCETPVLYVQENVQMRDGDELDEPYQLYPLSSRGDRSAAGAAPDDIVDDFAEAHRCFRAQANNATALMCRRVVEGVCQDKGAKGRDLKKKLKSLLTDGVIDKRLHDWADAGRVLGNEGAHGVDSRLSRQDSEDALHFTEALLNYLYVFEDRYLAYQGRQDRKAARKAAAAAEIAVD